MNPLSNVLHSIDYEPVSPDGATVVVTVYHEETMDEPHSRRVELSNQELAAMNDVSVSEGITDIVRHSIMSLLKDWRG